LRSSWSSSVPWNGVTPWNRGHDVVARLRRERLDAPAWRCETGQQRLAFAAEREQEAVRRGTRESAPGARR
jgi:hypothetical protein